MPAPEARSPVPRPQEPLMPMHPMLLARIGLVPYQEAEPGNLRSWCLPELGWAGVAEGTCEDVGTLSDGYCDWHEPGERLAAWLLVNTRRGYFTRKQ